MPELEHDRELIERLALVHEGNATAQMVLAVAERRSSDAPGYGWSQHDMLAASGLAIAASYWSLIAPHIAVQRYRRAAELYRSLGHSYWMVVALASAGDSEIATVASLTDESPAPSPQAVAFAMVANEVAGADREGGRRERLDAQWRHAGNVPIGRLGIPLDHYARTAQAMRAARADPDIERFLADAAAYVHRAAEVLRSASHDRFHWLRLQSTVLPAEPEAVAMTTAMSIVSHQTFGEAMSQMKNLDAHGRRLVEIGEEMRQAARREDDRARGELEAE